MEARVTVGVGGEGEVGEGRAHSAGQVGAGTGVHGPGRSWEEEESCHPSPGPPPLAQRSDTTQQSSQRTPYDCHSPRAPFEALVPPRPQVHPLRWPSAHGSET